MCIEGTDNIAILELDGSHHRGEGVADKHFNEKSVEK
jgi:hypothetical protein